VVYASGVNGIAGHTATDLAPDLGPLFDAVIESVGASQQRPSLP
jgi:predicted membrane GTPase involved in stress response